MDLAKLKYNHPNVPTNTEMRSIKCRYATLMEQNATNNVDGNNLFVHPIDKTLRNNNRGKITNKTQL